MVPGLGAAVEDRPRRPLRSSPWTIATPSTACIEPPNQAATAPQNRPPRIDPFTWGVARHPLRPFDHGARGFKANRPCAISDETEAAAMVDAV